MPASGSTASRPSRPTLTSAGSRAGSISQATRWVTPPRSPTPATSSITFRAPPRSASTESPASSSPISPPPRPSSACATRSDRRPDVFDDFYGLTGKPFQLTPDPAFYFRSVTHRKALSYLGYGLAQGEG